MLLYCSPIENRRLKCICIDWNIVSTSKEEYQRIVNAIPDVGVIFANFIKKIQKYAGLKMKRLHLSLGGHVAGKVGEKLGGTVKSIVGMVEA